MLGCNSFKRTSSKFHITKLYEDRKYLNLCTGAQIVDLLEPGSASCPTKQRCHRVTDIIFFWTTKKIVYKIHHSNRPIYVGDCLGILFEKTITAQYPTSKKAVATS